MKQTSSGFEITIRSDIKTVINIMWNQKGTLILVEMKRKYRSLSTLSARRRSLTPFAVMKISQPKERTTLPIYSLTEIVGVIVTP
jgi:hypothetical protein